jgi:hypothetical protein
MSMIEGGCHCGAIRYECSDEAAMSALCYCTDCQHASGSAFSADFIVLKKSFKLLKGNVRKIRNYSR